MHEGGGEGVGVMLWAVHASGLHALEWSYAPRGGGGGWGACGNNSVRRWGGGWGDTGDSILWGFIFWTGPAPGGGGGMREQDYEAASERAHACMCKPRCST